MYAGDHHELLQAVGQGSFVGLENLITRKIGLEDLVDKGIKGLIYEMDEMGTVFGLYHSEFKSADNPHSENPSTSLNLLHLVFPIHRHALHEPV